MLLPLSPPKQIIANKGIPATPEEAPLEELSLPNATPEESPHEDLNSPNLTPEEAPHEDLTPPNLTPEESPHEEPNLRPINRPTSAHATYISALESAW